MRIKIDGQYYNHFDELIIKYSLDSVASTFSFKGRFDPRSDQHRRIFRPLQYQKVEIFDEKDALRLTGFIVVTDLKSTESRALQSISGYSLPGVLEDCSIPYEFYPIEKNNVSLIELCQEVCGYFDLQLSVSLAVQDEASLVYKKVVAEPSQSVKDFVSKLASQRNIIVGHDEYGTLLLFKADVTGNAVRYYNKKNTVSMSISVAGQSLHSRVTVLRQPNRKNKKLTPVDFSTNGLVGLRREKVKVLSTGTVSETKKAADNLVAEELMSIGVVVVLNSVDNDLRCGDVVEVENDEIFLYSRQRFVIKDIVQEVTSKSENMKLQLALPETFTGETPKNIFE